MIDPSRTDGRRALGAPDPIELIDVGRSRLAIKRWGAGRPVVCLHAVGHGGGDYAQLATRVGDQFELIAVDWPAQGRSPDDGKPVRAAHYADLLLGVCDALKLDRPIVIGNSIGGTAALIAAAKAPERFAALVLCNPGGLAPLDSAARLVIRRMAAFFAAGARGAAWFPAAFAAYYRVLVLPRAPAEAQRKRIVQAGRELAPLLADAWRGFAEPDGDLRELVTAISVPVWLAWAKGDLFVSWGRSKAAAMQLPRHQLTLFKGGHSAFLESPDDFAKGFIAFAAG